MLTEAALMTMATDRHEAGPRSLVGWLRQEPRVTAGVKSVGSLPVSLVDVAQPSGMYVRDAGDECALQLILEGFGRARFDHGEGWIDGVIRPGLLALSPPGERLAYETERQGRFLCLTLPSSLMRAAAGTRDGQPWTDFGAAHERQFWSPGLIQVLLALAAAVSAGGAQARPVVDEGVLAIGGMLDRLGRTGAFEAMPEARIGPLDKARLRRAEAFARANLHRPIGVSELAEVAGVTQTRFYWGLRWATGRRLPGWLSALRVERAVQYLTAHPMLEPQEAALFAGFGSAAQLARAFRRERGRSFAEWLKERGA